MDDSQPIRVLFICLGNICRSPAAEGAFQKLVLDQGLSHKIFIDSCGTGNWHIGELPHHLTRKVAKEHGIDLTHKARQFRGNLDFLEFDYLIAMDRTNYKDVLNQLGDPSLKPKLYLFRDFENKPYRNSNGSGESVPDPYFGGLDGFYQVQELVTKCSKGLLSFIKEERNVE